MPLDCLKGDATGPVGLSRARFVSAESIVLLPARFRIVTAIFDAWLCRDGAFAVVTGALSSSSSRASSWFGVEADNTVTVVAGCVDVGAAGSVDTTGAMVSSSSSRESS
jgi:translation initiation factor 6 (eIF-6)